MIYVVIVGLPHICNIQITQKKFTMDEQTEEWELLEKMCKDEEFEIAYLFIEFPNGSSYQYQG